ncbi:DUF4157 domain-containing protein [Actinomycetospora cinnamomea]|uniref:eCIS core domain-containing protein n=1 Tax=Actinomycetospora cinnamomea TaxID=663609 RepID=UPI0024343965|nr:DUF4157 domain-containing protein [Actinomycetospora cinnamomea]
MREASSGLSTPSAPLPAGTRRVMESHLGHDLSGVRVHDGPDAARAAAALGANAYTIGQDVVFGAGRYRPDSSAGRRLLTHELTHTVQQRGAGHVGLRLGSPGDRHEHEADRVATAGSPQRVPAGSSERALQCDLAGDLVRGGLQLGATTLGGPIAGLAVGAWLNLPQNRQMTDDLGASLAESPRHIAEFFSEELKQIVEENWPEILVVTGGLIGAEAIIAGLGAAPTGISQIIAAILQILVLAYLGYSVVMEVVGAVEHGMHWVQTALTAQGDPRKITEASRSFVRMVWHILMAIVNAFGFKARLSGPLFPRGATPRTPAPTGGGGARPPGELIDLASRRPRIGPLAEPAPPSAPAARFDGNAAPKIAPEPLIGPPAPAPAPMAAPVLTGPWKAPAPAPKPPAGLQPIHAAAAGLAAGEREEEKKRADEVYAFGNTTKPAEVRTPKDIRTDADGYVASQEPFVPTLSVEGKSTFAKPWETRLTGWYYGVPKAVVPATDGLGIVADGLDVGGTHLPTHHTIYPRVRMLFTAFRDKVAGLPWVRRNKQ